MSETDGSAQDDVEVALQNLVRALTAASVADYRNYDRINGFRRRALDMETRWLDKRAAHRDPANKAKAKAEPAPDDPRPYYGEADGVGNVSRTAAPP